MEKFRVLQYITFLFFFLQSFFYVQAEDVQKTEQEIRKKIESRYPAPEICKSAEKNSKEAIACESVRIKIQNLDQRMSPHEWTEEYGWKVIDPHRFPQYGCNASKETALECARKILQQDFQNILSDLFLGSDCAKYDLKRTKALAKYIFERCKSEKMFQKYYSCIAEAGLEGLRAKKFFPNEAAFLESKLNSLKEISQELKILEEYCKKKHSSVINASCGVDYLIFASNIRSVDLLNANKEKLQATAIGLDRFVIEEFSENKQFCTKEKKSASKKKKNGDDCEDCQQKKAVPQPMDAKQIGDIAMMTVHVDASGDEVDEKSVEVAKAIDEAFKEKQNDLTLTTDQKKTLDKLSKDKKYKEGLKEHYSKIAKNQNEVKKNLDLALTQMLDSEQKAKTKKENKGKEEDPEFTLDDDIASSIKVSEKSKTDQNALDLNPEDLEKKEKEKSKKLAQEKKELLEKVKKNFENKVPVTQAKPHEKPKEQVLSKADQGKVAAKSVRSKSDLADEATSALEDFKEGKNPSIQYGEFFLETEVHEKKEKSGVSTTDEEFKTLYGNWLKSKARYEKIANETHGSDTDKVMAVMKALNQDYSFDYTLPYAHTMDLLAKKGGNCLATTKFITSVMKDLNLKPSANQVYGMQVLDDHVQPVLYDKSIDEVTMLVDGSKQRGVIAPIVKTEAMIHQYLKSQGKDTPTKYEDFMIQDVSQAIKDKALAGASRAKEQGIDKALQKQINTNSDLNFPKIGLYFAQGDGFAPPSMKANQAWQNGAYRSDAKDFYNGSLNSIDAKGWQALSRQMEEYEAPTINYDNAQSDMREALTSSTYKEYLKLKQDPMLLMQGGYTEEKIQELVDMQDEIYQILEGESYVSGKNKQDGQVALGKKLAQENPELQSLYGLLIKEREPLLKDGAEGDAEKGKYFDLFKVLGPENWSLYKKLQAPRLKEDQLVAAIEKQYSWAMGFPKATPEDLDSYFLAPEKVSFKANYKARTDDEKDETPTPNDKNSALKQAKTSTVMVDKDEETDLEAKHQPVSQKAGDGKKASKDQGIADAAQKAKKGQGKDASGILFKPEKDGFNKLKPIEFAQFIQQGIQDGKTGMASRFTPTLTAALRDKKEYTKEFVEWFTKDGFRAVSDAREVSTHQISGPDKKPIPKDVAVLLVDYLKGKDATGAKNIELKAQIAKNYGSVEKYLEQVKQDFTNGKKAPLSSPTPNTDDDNFAVFKKLAETKGIDSSIIDNAEKKSFKYKKRLPETFIMGSPPSEKDRLADEKQHEVKLTKAYNIQLTPVTQLQWYLVMGDNPSRFKDSGSSDGDHEEIKGTQVNVNHPVEQVSWEDAQRYIQKLNGFDGKCTYRLPTEAEWEAAARAKTTTAYSFGNDPSQLSSYGWYSENSNKRTHAVAEKNANPKSPNPEGLYDMHGNVWQWTGDWYGEYEIYDREKTTDPRGAPAGSGRVIRGGGWGNGAQYLRSAQRHDASPGFRSDYLGFRLVRTCP